MEKHNPLARRVALLSALLGGNLWRQVLRRLTPNELARLNRLPSEPVAMDPVLRARLVETLYTFLSVRRRERQRATALLGCDTILLALHLLALLTGLLLALFQVSAGADDLRLQLQAYAAAGGGSLLFYALFSIVLRLDQGVRLGTLLVPLEQRAALSTEQGPSRQWVRDLLWGVVGGILLFVLLAGINLLGHPLAHIPRGGYLVVHLAAGLWFAPLLEEGFFRHLIGGYFLHNHGHGPALFWSSLAFALAHQPRSPLEAVLYFLCGCILALLWLRRRNLLAPLVAHSLGNLLIIIQGMALGG